MIFALLRAYKPQTQTSCLAACTHSTLFPPLTEIQHYFHMEVMYNTEQAQVRADDSPSGKSIPNRAVET